MLLKLKIFQQKHLTLHKVWVKMKQKEGIALISYFDDNFSVKELTLLGGGREQCARTQHYGPFMAGCYLFHMVLGGRGYFDDGKNEYALSRGDGFLICPDKITFYRAEKTDPWDYAWFIFSGGGFLEEMGLSAENPIYHTDKADEAEKSFMKFLGAYAQNKGAYVRIAEFYRLISDLTEYGSIASVHDKYKNIKHEYVRTAKSFVDRNYHRNIKVSDICCAVNLERTYLYRLFEKYEHMSPKDYILKRKIDSAKKILCKPGVNIVQAALSVGYDNLSAFSNAFKKQCGMLPTQYKAIVKSNRFAQHGTTGVVGGNQV